MSLLLASCTTPYAASVAVAISIATSPCSGEIANAPLPLASVVVTLLTPVSSASIESVTTLSCDASTTAPAPATPLVISVASAI